MSSIYDNWERLVEAVLKREQLRHLALCESFSTSISTDVSARFSFDSLNEDGYASRISRDTIDSGAFSKRANISYHEEQQIEFDEIKKATKNFRPDRISGEGGFGYIFKGWIDEHTLTASKPGFGMAVTVKVWCPEGLQESHQERMNEIHYLSQLRHPNLVRLIGYCNKEENLILVYESTPKGSLDNHLFRRHQSLSWKTRVKVATGAARGLSFLHDRGIRVIPRNFGSRAILLDAEFSAKLSDFSLTRDDPTTDMNLVSTRVMGTYGYAAPEYITTGNLTAKSDVYSFGVVLLELLCGLPAFDRNRVRWQHNLVKWAEPYMCDGRKMLRIMDAKLEGQYPHKAAYTVATLALQCLNFEPKRRPRMVEVLAALEKL